MLIFLDVIMVSWLYLHLRELYFKKTIFLKKYHFLKNDMIDDLHKTIQYSCVCAREQVTVKMKYWPYGL